MPVTAFPVIQVATGGSDSLASGAPGGSAAITGTLAVPTTTSIAIADAVNLGGVPLDGSACLYLADATAGHRNFDQITNITGSSGAWVVTVANGFTTSASNFNWAIGGQRATIGGAVSTKLFSNNAAVGDAMPGWAEEMQSAYTETLSATFALRRAGDFVSGNIELRGAAGAATQPILTFSNNGVAFSLNGLNQSVRNFTINNSNATKTASVAFSITNATSIQLTRINCSGSTSGTQFWKAVNITSGAASLVTEECYFANQASHSIDLTVTSPAVSLRLKNSIIAISGGSGLLLSGTTGVFTIAVEGSIIAYNTSKGISWANSGTITTTVNGYIEDSIIHGNGSDGLNITNPSTSYSPFLNFQIENNIFSYNGGFGINLSGSSITDAFLATVNTKIRGNAFFTNTSGKYAGMTVASSQYEQTGDPAGGLSSSSKDYTGAAHGLNFQSVAYKGDGYPPGGILYIGNTPGSYQYRDCGLQSQTLPPVHPLIISQPPSPPDW